jgi:predicted small lipoprotein YifL
MSQLLQEKDKELVMKLSKRSIFSALLIAGVISLTGCGGGGSDAPVEGLNAPKKVSAVEAKD